MQSVQTELNKFIGEIYKWSTANQWINNIVPTELQIGFQRLQAQIYEMWKTGRVYDYDWRFMVGSFGLLGLPLLGAALVSIPKILGFKHRTERHFRNDPYLRSAFVENKSW